MRNLATSGRARWRGLTILLLVAVMSLYMAGVPQRLTAQIFVQIIGFRIDNSLQGNVEPDAHWRSLSGGALSVEIQESQPGSDQFHTLNPSFKKISELVLSGPVISGGSDPEMHENGAGKFTVEIDGNPDMSQFVQSISIDPIEIFAIDVPGSLDGQFRQSFPGDPKFGEIEITVFRHQDSGELFEWWTDFANGVDDKREITLTAKRRDGAVGRTWIFHGAVPVTYSPMGAGYSPENNLSTETVVIRYEWVEFGEESGARQVVMHQLNSTVQEMQDSVSDISVAEILSDGGDGRQITYMNAFPTRYVFPQFTASGDGFVTEEVSFRAETLIID